VRPITVALTLLVLTAACENSADPLLFGQGGGGGGAITQAQAAGDWSFTVTKTTTLPCTVVSLADGSRLTAHLDVLADGTLNSATSSWQNGSVVFPLSGSVRLSDGITSLILSSGTGSASGMQLNGTITPTGTFTGTLTDPASGLSPMFSTLGCEYSTGGSKA
jgi:hypothetical protein